MLHRIFDYCDMKTILLSIRSVCKYLHSATNIYNRLELKYDPSSTLKYDILSRLIIQSERIVSLIIINKTSDKDDALSSFDKIFNIRQFTRLRFLTLDGIDCEIAKNFLVKISSESLTTLWFRVNDAETSIHILSTATRFNLRKLVLNKSNLIMIRDISWPIQWELRHLEIGICTSSQYHTIIKQNPHLQTFVMQDCVEYLEDSRMMISRSFDQPCASILKSLTIMGCSLSLEELELLLSWTPILIDLELIFHCDLFDSVLDGYCLEQIIKSKLPLLRQFTFFFSYKYFSRSDNAPNSIKSIIAPFRTPFWLEEKSWFVICDHVFEMQVIELYTIPAKIRHESTLWFGRSFEYMPFHARRQYLYHLTPNSVFSEHGMNNVNNLLRCEISSADYICRFTRTSSNKTNEEAEEEALVILDLSKRRIDDNMVQDLADALEQDNTCATLNLSNNSIQDIGAHYLANMLKHNTTLNAIDLSGNGIGDLGAQFLVECLKHNTTLMALNLNGNSGQSCLVVEAILKSRTDRTLLTLKLGKNKTPYCIFVENIVNIRGDRTLTTVNMSNHRLEDDDVRLIITALKDNKALVSLNMSKNQFGYLGLQHLTDLLRHITIFTTLDLSANQIDDKGTEALVSILRNLMTLTTLNISNNQISNHGIKAITDALKYSKTLTKLDLSSNQIDATGAHYLAEALEHNQTTVTSLNISNNSIGPEGAKCFANTLRNTKTLNELIMSNNRIGNTGAEHLSDALKENTTLTIIDLSSNQIVGHGILNLANALKKNTTLTTLHYRNNRMQSIGTKYLADALKCNNSLTLLSLQCNEIGDNGALHLVDALKNNKALQKIYLGRNGISTKVWDELTSIGGKEVLN
ncbi:unnamed protein product [Adineta steineri]|uniref:Uncharacterized protein n=1 Tax=Adineta steineri TaxID=433720 RepID=A0A814ZAK7_9BILA|nr:unnamed protein product [Adineta steineri]CAF1239317.1 unnamed protein product [Adineta steineri]